MEFLSEMLYVVYYLLVKEHSRLYSQESWLSDPRRFHDPKGHENVSLPHRLVECQARPEKGEYGRYVFAQVESYARIRLMPLVEN